jgi:hypothetical protein
VHACTHAWGFMSLPRDEALSARMHLRTKLTRSSPGRSSRQKACKIVMLAAMAPARMQTSSRSKSRGSAPPFNALLVRYYQW